MREAARGSGTSCHATCLRQLWKRHNAAGCVAQQQHKNRLICKIFADLHIALCTLGCQASLNGPPPLSPLAAHQSSPVSHLNPHPSLASPVEWSHHIREFREFRFIRFAETGSMVQFKSEMCQFRARDMRPSLEHSLDDDDAKVPALENCVFQDARLRQHRDEPPGKGAHSTRHL